MEKYTEEKKQYYMNIMNAISEHKDFGKRNPVDIGIDCGYTEEDVLGMIEMLRKMQGEEDGKKATGEEKNNGNKYYFLLHQGYDEKAYIVSVDIDTWKVEIVKTVNKFNNITLFGDYINIWQIRKNIFVYVISHIDKEDGLIVGKEVHWENLETGEQRKLLTDGNIQNLIIRESDVCIITENDIILWKDDGSVYKKEDAGGFCSSDLLIEADDKIYIVGSSSVYKLDNNLNKQEIWSKYDLYRIGAVEYFNGKLSWYRYQENVHLFSSSSWSYEKHSEGEGYFYSTDSTGFYAPRLNASSGILVGVFSNNYRLLQDEIWSIDNKHKICSFKRKTSKDSNQGQVISIPEKDIFIGVGGNDREEYLIKIDLRNERQAVTLPVELPKE